MNLIKKFSIFIIETWLTGLLYIFGALAYIFYYSLLVVRIMLKFFKTSLFILFIILSGGAFYLWNIGFNAPEEKLGDETIVAVERGSSIKRIAMQLQSEGVLNSGKIFYYFLRVYRPELQVQAGNYRFQKNSGPLRSLAIIEQGPFFNDIQITIPEGLHIWQFASLAQRQIGLDSARVVQLATDSAFISSLSVVSPIGTLEGFLYPETYSLPENATEEQLLQRVVSEFHRRWAELPHTEIMDRYTQFEIVTLASIVEKETQVSHELPRVSAVFHNRLDRGITIGADATVRYAIQKFTGPLRVSELNVDSPYNTRRFRGIPKGPICSPGSAALRATVQPIESDELFFVAKWDGSGEHYFSRTNAEHERRKLEIRRANEHIANW